MKKNFKVKKLSYNPLAILLRQAKKKLEIVHKISYSSCE